MAKKSKENGSSSASNNNNKQDQDGLPDALLENQRTRVRVGNAGNENTRGIYYSGAYTSLGYDNSFSLDKFKKNFKINVLSDKPDHLVFEMIGVDAPIANALRRILISEIPTMAIERVFMINNTSILQDEVLAHRLGLIPIKVDPKIFNYKEPGKEYTAEDTLIFTLKVRCYKDANGETINGTVLSKHLTWVPTDDQNEMFPNEADHPRPAYDDIPIVKLRPGQALEVQCYCEKNIGREHIKWSPVGTAFYKILPEISVSDKVTGEKAKKLKQSCPMNVYDIEDSGKAFAARPMDCTMCRECIRDPEMEPFVKLERVRDHFIFSIESVGTIAPKTLFQDAIKILIDKCSTVENSLNTQI
ncbi:RNA polymerase III subunit [Heterostelium album PN500]|uniref:DNA-directed RNA polymerases I and III subunit RPAC1 n=1 Tax=Heterostelium pallidum (strain ATCC 26659 / Pp 5 / PN500) TaxID=670386 RepID=D3B3A4_HETP5|nr:RNA polymerase III subunit [Heterostelium album PN500]EFA83802.1 RNA polymerase III subunit [Heterostelium album PN500]|eukprot:XP_020435919.1 RNA polymerase III subunit [Heterostelium album PN500]